MSSSPSSVSQSVSRVGGGEVHNSSKEDQIMEEALTGAAADIAEALSEIKSIIPPDFKLDGDCPTCLEPLPPFWDGKARALMYCCGKYSCRKCADEAAKTVTKMVKSAAAKGKPMTRAQIENLVGHCPLCRSKLPGKDREKVLLKNSSQGQAWAQYELGMMHFKCEAASPSPVLGTEFLKRSAMQGFPHALYVLGGMYHDYFGLKSIPGVELSIPNAMYCLGKAATYGHEEARFRLAGIQLKEGNDDKSLELLMTAASKGHVRANALIGSWYVHGDHGLKKSLPDGLRCLNLAAEKGDEDAIKFVNELHKKEEVVQYLYQ